MFPNSFPKSLSQCTLPALLSQPTFMIYLNDFQRETLSYMESQYCFSLNSIESNHENKHRESRTISLCPGWVLCLPEQAAALSVRICVGKGEVKGVLAPKWDSPGGDQKDQKVLKLPDTHQDGCRQKNRKQEVLVRMQRDCNPVHCW